MAKLNASAVMQEEFLQARARCLEIAATLDRIDQTDGGRGSLSPETTVMRDKIDQAIAILASPDSDRAARVQHLFSRSFDPDWRKNLGVPSSASK